MKLIPWIGRPTTVRRVAFSQLEQPVTCLAILLEANGYMISASEIRRGRPPSQCQFEKLEALSKELGFTLVKTTIDELSRRGETNISSIVHLQGHGSVVLSLEGKSLWINNPYVGINKATDPSQDRQLRRIEGLSIDKRGQETRLRRKKPSLLWSLLLSDKTLYSVAGSIVLISAIHGLVTLLDPIIKNVYFTNVVQMGITDWARTLAILYFLIAVSGGFLLLAGSALSLMLTSRLALKWSFNTYTSLLRLPVDYIRMRSSGDLMNRVRSSERIGTFVGNDEIMLIGSTLNLGLLFIVLLSTSVPLAIMLLCIQLIGIIFVVKTNSGWKTRSDHLQQQSALESGSFVSLIGTVRLLRQQKMTRNAFRVHQLVVNRRTRAQQNMSLYTILVRFGSTSIDTVQSVVLLTMAGLLIMEGQITLGQYIAFQAILGSVIAPVKRISSFISSLQTLRATHDRILDIIEEASLQEKHGIGDRLADEYIITISTGSSSREEDSSTTPEDGSLDHLRISRGQTAVCLRVRNGEQKEYFEVAVGGGRLLAKSTQINISHKEGVRELLIACARPHLYSGTVRDNVTLGFLSRHMDPKNNCNEIAEFVGWPSEYMSKNVEELAEDELDLKRLSIARAMWRGASGILVSDLDYQGDESKRSALMCLIRKISNRHTPIIFVTTEEACGDVTWSQVYDISSLVDRMISADEQWLRV